jgi:hypothetical protein
VTERCTETVAIIGAGIGGLYLVAELGLAGFRLRLHDIDDSRLSEIRVRGGVDVEGQKGGFVAVDRATTDLPSAIDGADIIIVVTGGNTQAAVARSLAPLVRDGQLILLIQGNTGGSLIVRRALDEAGCRADIDVAEMDNYPYSCWLSRQSEYVRSSGSGGCRSRHSRGTALRQFFRVCSPCFRKRSRRRIPCTPASPTPMRCLHVANCVANAGRIESGDSYKFYAEGVTPACHRSVPSSRCTSPPGSRPQHANSPHQASSNGSLRSTIYSIGSRPARWFRSNPAASVRGPPARRDAGANVGARSFGRARLLDRSTRRLSLACAIGH